jgi:hypothetical protein
MNIHMRDENESEEEMLAALDPGIKELVAPDRHQLPDAWLGGRSLPAPLAFNNQNDLGDKKGEPTEVFL